MSQAPQEQSGSHKAATAHASGAAANILVVDDNPVNQKLAGLMLKRMGYTVDIAENGLEAVEAVSRSSYGAVLMDVQMPIMDGYQATAQIRRREGTHHTPIIAVTASAMPEGEDQCRAAGMDGYVTKPVDWDHVAALLEHWTSRSDEKRNDIRAASTPVEDPPRRRPGVPPDPSG